MAEWSNATVLKTVISGNRDRGFESLSLLHFCKDKSGLHKTCNPLLSLINTNILFSEDLKESPSKLEHLDYPNQQLVVEKVEHIQEIHPIVGYPQHHYYLEHVVVVCVVLLLYLQTYLMM